jgi:biotin transporter BioY
MTALPELANLAIAISYGLILVVVLWSVIRHRNWRRLPPEGVVASILTILFVASCGWGHWLHFRAGMSQRWDVTTAIISAMAAVGVLLYAEPMAGTLRAMLNAKKQVT